MAEVTNKDSSNNSTQEPINEVHIDGLVSGVEWSGIPNVILQHLILLHTANDASSLTSHKCLLFSFKTFQCPQKLFISIAIFKTMFN